MRSIARVYEGALRGGLDPVDLVHVEDPDLPSGADPQTLRVFSEIPDRREKRFQPFGEILQRADRTRYGARSYFVGAWIRVI